MTEAIGKIVAAMASTRLSLAVILLLIAIAAAASAQELRFESVDRKVSALISDGR